MSFIRSNERRARMQSQTAYNQSTLWKELHYNNPAIEYLIDTNLMEYDIEKANISVLRYKGIISDKLYRDCLVMPKLQRQILVGKLQAINKGAYPALKEGIMEARHCLFDTLQLRSEDVLSINNDAVFVMTDGLSINLPENLQVNEFVKFRIKGRYRSYYRIGSTNFYYNISYQGPEYDVLDIKGLGDYAEGKHKDCMLASLKEIFRIAILNGSSEALHKINDLYSKYVRLELPIDYYRRLDSSARFDVKFNGEFSSYQIEEFIFPDRTILDISYNLNILGRLAGYMTQDILRVI